MALSWTTPTLNAGFYGNPQHSIEAVGTGIVRLRGVLTGPSTNVDDLTPRVAWTMPAGSRPLQQLRLHAVDASGRHNVLVTIAPSGDLSIAQEPAPNRNESLSVNIDGLTYCGEQ